MADCSRSLSYSHPDTLASTELEKFLMPTLTWRIIIEAPDVRKFHSNDSVRCTTFYLVSGPSIPRLLSSGGGFDGGVPTYYETFSIPEEFDEKSQKYSALPSHRSESDYPSEDGASYDQLPDAPRRSHRPQTRYSPSRGTLPHLP